MSSAANRKQELAALERRRSELVQAMMRKQCRGTLTLRERATAQQLRDMAAARRGEARK